MPGFNDLSASQAIYAHRYSLFHPEVAVRSPYVTDAFGAASGMTPGEFAANDFANRVHKLATDGAEVWDILSNRGLGIVNLTGYWLGHLDHRAELQMTAMEVAQLYGVQVRLRLPESSQIMVLVFGPPVSSQPAEEPSVWDKVTSAAS